MKKIEITINQAEKFNDMLECLRRIAGKSKKTSFMTTDELRNHAAKADMGIDFEEELEMAYDNMQGDAGQACHGVRPIMIHPVGTVGVGLTTDTI